MRLRFSWAMALVSVVAVWCSASPVRAQAPVVPSSPAILGYIHMENPGAPGDLVQQLLAQAGLAPDAFTSALAGTIGDLRMTILPHDQSITIAWVQPQGDTGPAKRVVVLPAMQTAGNDYLADCMVRTKQTCTALQGLSFIAQQGSAAWLEPLSAPLKELHQATQATDISFYFRAPMLAESHDAIVRALAEIRLSDPASLLRAARFSLAPPAASAPAAGASPAAPAASPAKTAAPAAATAAPADSQDLTRIFGVLLQDLESAHVAVDATRSPLRVAVNLTARPDTPLAKFLGSSAPEGNPLVGFVPADGFLRLAMAYDSAAADKLARDVLARAYPASDLRAARGHELTDLADSLFNLGDQASLMVRPPKSDGSLSWFLVTTPRDPAGAALQLQNLAERSDIFVGAPKAAPGATPTAAPGGAQTPQPVLPVPASAAAGQTHRTLLVAPAAEMLEKFPIGRMDDAATASTTPGGSAPFLLFCPVGPRFVAASDRASMVASVNRVLRLEKLWPGLLSQKTFVEGGNVYLDLRPAAQADQPWAESPAPILATARAAGNCAQIVVSVPMEMLGAPAPAAAAAVPAAAATTAAPAVPGAH